MTTTRNRCDGLLSPIEDGLTPFEQLERFERVLEHVRSVTPDLDEPGFDPTDPEHVRHRHGLVGLTLLLEHDLAAVRLELHREGWSL